MMQIYGQDHTRLGLLTGYKGLEVVEVLKTGDKTMSFNYPANGPNAGDLVVENYLRTKEDEFVLKDVKVQKGWLICRAVLNLEDLTGKSWPSFEEADKTPRECMDTALEGTGWTVGVCQVEKRRTIRKDSPVNALEIVNQCIKTYKLEIVYRSKDRMIDVYERIGQDRGVYFMEAVNLRKPPSVSRATTEFFTQIRPIGKNGLRIDVNGKDYLENHSYSPKDLMLTWKDERYTNAEDLAEDAALKLEEICRPAETYEADVVDLAAVSPEYSVLEYGLGDMVTLISKTSGVKKKLRIAQLTRYPQTKEKNKCQLSNAKKSFSDMMEEVVEEAVQTAGGSAGAGIQSAKDEVLKINEDAIEQFKADMAKVYATTGDVESALNLYTKIEVLDGYMTKQAAADLEARIGEGVAAGLSAKANTSELNDFKDAVAKTYATVEGVDTALTLYAKTEVLDGYMTKQAAADLEARIGEGVAAGLSAKANASDLDNYESKSSAATMYATIGQTTASIQTQVTKLGDSVQGLVKISADLINLNAALTASSGAVTAEKMWAKTSMSIGSGGLTCAGPLNFGGKIYSAQSITSTSGASLMALAS